jgi:type IV pilus assembly protein PilX
VSALRWERGRERGAALVCALLLMLAAMLVGVSVCRAVFASIASAGAGRERSLAYGAAEAALLDAERDIAGAFAGADPARSAHFSAAGVGGFIDGCGHGGSGLGLCRASLPPAWQLQDLADPDNASLVPYGHYTGASLASGKGLLPARPPAYLIESIAPPGAGASLGSFYRITAIGFGSHASTQVVLQSVVRKPKPAAAEGGGDQGNGTAANQPVDLPAGRIGWREIPNWPRLHAQATE